MDRKNDDGDGALGCVGIILMICVGAYIYYFYFRPLPNLSNDSNSTQSSSYTSAWPTSTVECRDAGGYIITCPHEFYYPLPNNVPSVPYNLQNEGNGSEPPPAPDTHGINAQNVFSSSNEVITTPITVEVTRSISISITPWITPSSQ